MAFPTVECHLGLDLNSDGDTTDTILRYQNLETGKVVNTTLNVSGAHHAIDIYENIIAFVGEGSQICYYDINACLVRGIGAIGSHPSIYGDIITFTSEDTIHYFDLSTQILVDTEIKGYAPVISRYLIVFRSRSVAPTIWIYDLRTKAARVITVDKDREALINHKDLPIQLVQCDITDMPFNQRYEQAIQGEDSCSLSIKIYMPT